MAYLGATLGIIFTAFMIWLDFKDRTQQGGYTSDHMLLHTELFAIFNSLWVVCVFCNRFSFKSLSTDEVKACGMFFRTEKPYEVRQGLMDVAPWVTSVVIRHKDDTSKVWHKFVPGFIQSIMYKYDIGMSCPVSMNDANIDVYHSRRFCGCYSFFVFMNPVSMIVHSI